MPDIAARRVAISRTGIEHVETADGLYLLVEVGHVRGDVRERVGLRQGAFRLKLNETLADQVRAHTD